LELVEEYQSTILPRYFEIPSDTLIYHYTSAKALINILSNCELHLSNVLFMNDLDEQVHSRRLVGKYLEDAHFSEKPEIDKFYHDIYREEFQKRLDRYDELQFVLSTTLESDSLHMWNYYGEDDGYAIGFRLNQLMPFFWEKAKTLITKSNGQLHESNIFNGRILYNHQRQKEFISDSFDFFNRVLSYHVGSLRTEKEGKANLQTSMMSINFRNGLYNMKLEPHHIENEYRIIVIPNKGFDNIQFRSAKGLAVPYIVINIERLPIASITIGPKVKDVAAEIGIRQLLEKTGNQGVKIKHSQLHVRW